MRREAVFEVDFPPTEVAGRLREVIGNAPTMRTLFTEPNRDVAYVGDVTDSSFSARRPGRNTFKVFADGLISPTDRGSRVAVRLLLPPQGLVVAFALSLLGMAMVMVAGGMPWVAVLLVGGSVLVVVAGIVQPRRDADTMMRILSRNPPFLRR